jgi:hypothetical protein
MKIRMVLVSLFLLSFAPLSSGATYYVAPEGDDSHTTLQAQSPDTPWKTISKATSEAQAGDTILVADGLYEEGEITFAHSGTSSAWITLKAAPGANPTITKPGELRGIFIYERSYITIDGFAVKGFDNDGIGIFWSDHILCENIHAYDNGNAGIDVVGTNYVIIQDSILHHNGWNPQSGWGDGLSINNHYLFDEVDQWYSVVRRNLMYANFQKNERVWDGNGMTLDQAGTGGVHIMANNIFFNNGGKGILNATTGNMAIIHNVLFRNLADYNMTHGMGDMVLSNDWVGNTILKNNILYARPRTAYYQQVYPVVRDGDPNENEVIENNLIWGENEENTRIYWFESVPIDTWIQERAPTTLRGDPGFIGAPFNNGFTTFRGGEWIDMEFEDYDFSLKSDSQCIDVGAFLTHTTSAGTGTQIQVETARYFTDGFGMVGEGDVIQIGFNEPVQITDVDYETNTITVDRSLSWNQEDGVSFPFQGTLPDVGALEYSRGNVFYVSPAGSDNNPGSLDRPWKTIQKAADSLQPGDTVYIREGVYNEQVQIRISGSLGSPITFINYPGETVIIDGEHALPAENYGGLINIQDQDHIHLIGLHVMNSNRFGIKVVGSSDHILVQDCEIAYSMDGGIVFQAYEGNPTHAIVDGCEVHGNNARGLDAVHEAISMDGVDTFEIMNNHVYDNGEEGIDAKVGARNGKIHHNRVHDNNGPNIYVDAADHIAIYGNEIYHTRGVKSGIMLGVEPYPNQPLTHHIDIYNNLIYDNNSGISFWIDSGAADYASISDVNIFHNTIHSNEENGGLWIINAPQNGYRNVVLRNNIFWENDSTGRDEIRDSTGSGQLGSFTIDHNLFKSGAISDTYGADSVQTSDVKFVDLSNHDYHLLPESPAIDTGIDVGILTDLDGNSRPQGAGPDLGAFEYPAGAPTFVDVPLDHPYHDYIEVLYREGYTAGCSHDPLMYCPERVMSRAESSVFVERGIHDAEYDPVDPTAVIFDDVALDAWYADWVHGLWDDGYTAGCGTDPLIYCPDQEHTRAEGCVFYLRMLYGADYVPADPKGYFADVDPEMWYAKWVDAAWEAGIAEPCGTEPELLFCPEDGLTRAVAAYMMVQAKEILIP